MSLLPPPPDADPASPYQPVPIGHLFPHVPGEFEVYLRNGDNHMLFARNGEALSPERRRILAEHEVRVVYISREEQGQYRDYMRRHLGEALLSQDMPLEDKAAVFYHDCCGIVRELVHERLPREVAERYGRMLMAYVRDSVAFLCTEGGLARMGALMVHDYDVYSHGVHVFVYTVFLLKSLGFSPTTIVQAGVGALLHDSGKEDIDVSILKKPGRLSPEEFLAIREHPARGVRRCRPLSLSRLAVECILMHHEKVNGLGYPRGLSGEAVPLHVRAVSLADVYDALTSRRIYADAVRPYEALSIMRHEMAGSFDLNLYKRFVMLLGGAALL